MGKTTAAIEVKRKVKTLKLLDKVIVIPMSQTTKIRNIQEYMTDILGVKLNDESEEGKTQNWSEI
jgi:hypothetical protein